MEHPVLHYLQQTGRSGNGIGPFYSTTPFLQRAHGIESFLNVLFRMVKPILWNGTKALGRETLWKGDKILRDAAENPHVGTRDIVSKHVNESTRTD
jgi:hypothetical protein